MPLAYRPFSPRQRALIVLLAVGTASGVVLTLLREPGGVARGRALRAQEPPACTSEHGAASHACVGGKLDVTPIAPEPLPAADGADLTPNPTPR